MKPNLEACEPLLLPAFPIMQVQLPQHVCRPLPLRPVISTDTHPNSARIYVCQKYLALQSGAICVGTGHWKAELLVCKAVVALPGLPVHQFKCLQASANSGASPNPVAFLSQLCSNVSSSMHHAQSS